MIPIGILGIIGLISKVYDIQSSYVQEYTIKGNVYDEDIAVSSYIENPIKGQ